MSKRGRVEKREDALLSGGVNGQREVKGIYETLGEGYNDEKQEGKDDGAEEKRRRDESSPRGQAAKERKKEATKGRIPDRREGKEKAEMTKDEKKEKQQRKGLKIPEQEELSGFRTLGGVHELPNSEWGQGLYRAQSHRSSTEAAATVSVFSSQKGPTGSSDDTEPCHSVVRNARKDGTSVNGNGFVDDFYSWLQDKIDSFGVELRKTSSKGRVFPLPGSLLVLGQCFPKMSLVVLGILRVLVWALNSLNGEGCEGPESASEYQRQVLEGLLEDCERVSNWSIGENETSWESFFRVKGVDYKGDEILTAQTMTWANVAPALPSEVGSVKLEEVVELGSLHYVQNFEEYLMDPKDQVYTKPPRVMVPPEDWLTFCDNLLKLGVFAKVHEDDLHKVQGKPILSGLFGVSKHEFVNSTEVHRIIMNLVPLNNVCRSMEGDVGTLPSWAGMTALNLQPHEQLVVSSEDVRAFFYIFSVPQTWHRFLAFNRPLPKELAGPKPGLWYPCSAVLPMGFKNSVSLAQHVHRYIVRGALKLVGTQGGEAELRKDRPFTSANPVYRIYLDNFDQLEKTSSEFTQILKGTVSPLIDSVRHEYARLGVPRHPKKGVARATEAEVQGALVDGVAGLAAPKVEKIAKYLQLTRLMIQAGSATQKQAQIVGGGLVYMSMFRRPLLGSLNHLWSFIVSFDGYPPVVKFPIPPEVEAELVRFLGLVPLAYMDFRGNISCQVTASDASEFGGGVTVSTNVTPAGAVAANCPIRGDLLEPTDVPMVLTVGLFDGIGALRAAADALGWNVVGHISVEKSTEASRVVESRFPNTIFVEDVQLVDAEMVKTWAQKFSQISVLLLGAGPPCQGVSKLNAARKGALRDSRSSLFVHVERIFMLCLQAFPWAQIRKLMENVASMDEADEKVMSESVGKQPTMIDAAGVSLAHRPRLYWCNWELLEGEGVTFHHTPSGRSAVKLQAALNPVDYLTPGWRLKEDKKLPTFTTSRPRTSPGYKPAGLSQCQTHELRRWEDDSYRFPPYQYQDCHCLVNKKGDLRLPSIEEREVIMGFPKGYTANCLPKKDQKSQWCTDTRLTLIGNSWNVTVVAWILSQLGQVLGLNEPLSVGDIVKRSAPGSTVNFQTFLHRPFMKSFRVHRPVAAQQELVRRFLSQISLKGEDIMLQSSSEDLVKYHRLRASVPAKLWSWMTVASWKWTGDPEHINCLEMRAVLTAIRWRLERLKKTRLKFVHLVDSLVVLHALSRGRTSSKKLRRTVLRINALLLATRSQSVWGYVHTSQNPADAPSRRPRKRRWKNAKKAS